MRPVRQPYHQPAGRGNPRHCDGGDRGGSLLRGPETGTADHPPRGFRVRPRARLSRPGRPCNERRDRRGHLWQPGRHSGCHQHSAGPGQRYCSSRPRPAMWHSTTRPCRRLRKPFRCRPCRPATTPIPRSSPRPRAQASAMQTALSQIGSVVSSMASNALQNAGTDTSGSVDTMATEAQAAFQQVVTLAQHQLCRKLRVFRRRHRQPADTRCRQRDHHRACTRRSAPRCRR